MNARYYNSQYGVFNSQDPVFWEVGQSEDGKKVLMNPQSQNSYGYALGNPIHYKDPSGRIVPIVAGAWFMLGMIGTGIGLSTYGAIKKDTDAIALGFGLQDVGLMGGSMTVQANGMMNPITGVKNQTIDPKQAMVIAVSKTNNWGRSETLVGHAKRHGRDFGVEKNDVFGYSKAVDNFNMRAEAGIKEGQSNFDSFVDKNNRTFFFDQKTGTMGIRNPNGTNASAYKPNNGNPQKALNYWNKQKASKGVK